MTDQEGRLVVLRRVSDLKDTGGTTTLRSFEDLGLEPVALSRYIEQLDELGLIKAKILRNHREPGNLIAQAVITITAKGTEAIETSQRDVQMTDERSARKSHCNSCNRDTNHLVLHAEVAESWEDVGEQGRIGGGGTYSTLQCRGCGSITFLSETWFSEDVDPEDGTYDITIQQWPPKPKYGRPRPSWMWGLSLSVHLEVANFLTEIYTALDNENLRLCALGIRALVEQIMIGQVGEQGSLGKNIDAFFAAGHVASRDQGHFRSTLIGLGDAAMHRGYTPKVQDIHTLLDMTESLIASIFVHPERAENVRARIPPRGGQ